MQSAPCVVVSLLPFTYATMFISSLSLIGSSFCTGFYCKNVILELAYTKYTVSDNFAFWLGLLCLLYFLSFFKFIFKTCLALTNSFKQNILMTIPLIFLAFENIFAKY